MDDASGLLSGLLSIALRSVGFSAPATLSGPLQFLNLQPGSSELAIVHKRMQGIVTRFNLLVQVDEPYCAKL